MSKQLEKWYVWSGEEEPKGCKLVMFGDGFIFNNSYRQWDWSGTERKDVTIIAYTLGEKVPSKREAK